MSVIITEDLAAKNVESGKDESGLGQWSWIRLQGKGGVTVRLILVYRLCSLQLGS